MQKGIMGISSRLCLSREGWKMSSCCLAACGRLAENSQSGEAALTLCGRALPAHLHPVGWGGGCPLGNSVLCPFPQLCALQGVQGQPPAHALLSQCCSTRPPLSIPIFPLDQRLRTAPKALPVSPQVCSPCPGRAQYFQPCQSQE